MASRDMHLVNAGTALNAIKAKQESVTPPFAHLLILSVVCHALFLSHSRLLLSFVNECGTPCPSFHLTSIRVWFKPFILFGKWQDLDFALLQQLAYFSITEWVTPSSSPGDLCRAPWEHETASNLNGSPFLRDNVHQFPY